MAVDIAVTVAVTVAVGVSGSDGNRVDKWRSGGELIRPPGLSGIELL